MLYYSSETAVSPALSSPRESNRIPGPSEVNTYDAAGSHWSHALASRIVYYTLAGGEIAERALNADASK